MSKPSKQERHRQQLRLRRDAERREYDRQDSDDLVREAHMLYREGDAPAAHRLARSTLGLTPDSVPALGPLGQIHFEGAQNADAAYYFGCKECWAPCPTRGKSFSRVCQTRCRCSGSAAGGARP